MIQETFWVRGEPRTKIQLDKLLTINSWHRLSFHTRVIVLQEYSIQVTSRWNKTSNSPYSPLLRLFSLGVTFSLAECFMGFVFTQSHSEESPPRCGLCCYGFLPTGCQQLCGLLIRLLFSIQPGCEATSPQFVARADLQLGWGGKYEHAADLTLGPRHTAHKWKTWRSFLENQLGCRLSSSTMFSIKMALCPAVPHRRSTLPQLWNFPLSFALKVST